MEKFEKRISPRQSLQIPIRFHSGEMTQTEPDIASETFNISREGLLMRSPLRLKIGEPLALTLRVPTYLSGNARSIIECFGRVVHERRPPQRRSRLRHPVRTHPQLPTPLRLRSQPCPLCTLEGKRPLLPQIEITT
jgi:hypothetical protein